MRASVFASLLALFYSLPGPRPGDVDTKLPWLRGFFKMPIAALELTSTPNRTADSGGGGGTDSSRGDAAEGEGGRPRGGIRKRPFIYVYDLPSEYNTRMLQYRLHRWVWSCSTVVVCI